MVTVALCTVGQAVAAPSAKALLVVDGVGQGAFDEAHINQNMGKDNLCATVSHSRGDVSALLKWMTSNRSVGALASKPDAVLSLLGSDGRPTAQYHLAHIEVTDFAEAPRKGNSAGPIALQKARIECEDIHAAH
jgi:hypothetical protein